MIPISFFDTQDQFSRNFYLDGKDQLGQYVRDEEDFTFIIDNSGESQRTRGSQNYTLYGRKITYFSKQERCSLILKGIIGIVGLLFLFWNETYRKVIGDHWKAVVSKGKVEQFFVKNDTSSASKTNNVAAPIITVATVAAPSSTSSSNKPLSNEPTAVLTTSTASVVSSDSSSQKDVKAAAAEAVAKTYVSLDQFRTQLGVLGDDNNPPKDTLKFTELLWTEGCCTVEDAYKQKSDKEINALIDEVSYSDFPKSKILDIYKNGLQATKGFKLTNDSMTHMRYIIHSIQNESQKTEREELLKQVGRCFNYHQDVSIGNIAKMFHRVAFSDQLKQFIHAFKDRIFDETLREMYPMSSQSNADTKPSDQFPHLKNSFLVACGNHLGMSTKIANLDVNKNEIEPETKKVEFISKFYWKFSMAALIREFLKEVNGSNSNLISHENFLQWASQATQMRRNQSKLFFFNAETIYPSYCPKPTQTHAEHRKPFISESFAIEIFQMRGYLECEVI